MKDFFTVLGVFFVGFLLGCLLTFLSLLPSKYVQGAEIQKDTDSVFVVSFNKSDSLKRVKADSLRVRIQNAIRHRKAN